MSFVGGIQNSNYNSTYGGAAGFEFFGRIYGDTTLGGTSGSNPETALNVAGPVTYLPWTFSGATPTIDLRYSDWYSTTLAANITSITFSNATNQAREIKFVFTQAASGGPYTVGGWPANVTWSLANGSAAPTMPSAASSILMVTLRSIDQSHWVGSY